MGMATLELLQGCRHIVTLSIVPGQLVPWPHGAEEVTRGLCAVPGQGELAWLGWVWVSGKVVHISLPGELQCCSKVVTGWCWELCLVVSREQCALSPCLSGKVKGLENPTRPHPLVGSTATPDYIELRLVCCSASATEAERQSKWAECWWAFRELHLLCQQQIAVLPSTGCL